VISAAEGRANARAALAEFLGTSPDDDAVRHLDGVSVLESQRASGWRAAGKGSKNLGGIQAGSGWTGKTFQYTDTHPNPDGTSTPYTVAFRWYDTWIEAYLDLSRVMYGGARHLVLLAAKWGDTYGVSQLMRETGYYEGFGPTQQDRIRNHYLALRRSVVKADFELGFDVPRYSDLPIGYPGTVRFGSIGDDVKTAQRELGAMAPLVADGIFGRITEAAAKAYQEQHAMLVDGIVGPKTWQTLFTDGYTP
jgi:peptidoglycan hydrolase-like protein with peptidoglycan-binding domain